MYTNIEELNTKAAELLVNKNYDGIRELAKENGIDTEDAEDYIDGVINILATPLTAAYGKLDLEEKDLKLSGLLKDWKGYIALLCSEDTAVCEAVLSKDMAGCMGKILKHSFDTKEKVSDRICKAAGLKNDVYMGVPSAADVKKIIREYYLGGKQ